MHVHQSAHSEWSLTAQPSTATESTCPGVYAGFGHLVVCTSSHCHVYSTSNFNTPHIFDLKEQPQLVLQCSRNFALLGAAGLQVRRLKQLPDALRVLELCSVGFRSAASVQGKCGSCCRGRTDNGMLPSHVMA
jgi:hypothetical protein